MKRLSLLLLFLPTLPMSAFDHFVTRRGAEIFDGDKPFNYVGGNLPEVTHVRTDWDLREASRMRLPTTEEIDYLVGMAAQSNMRVIRTWCFPDVAAQNNVPHSVSYFHVNPDGKTVTLNETAFRLFDHFLARCRAEGLRVSIPFFYKWDNWKWPSPELQPHFADFIVKVLTRKNTITGVAYNEDPTIYAWANGNEFKRTPTPWIRAVAALVKKHAPRQLFMDARMGAQEIFNLYLKGDRTLLDDPNIDLVSYHLYEPRAEGWDVPTTMVNIHRGLLAGNKALVVGEISPKDNADTVRRLITTVRENNIHGILYWSWKGVKSQGGYMQWNGKGWGPHDDLKWPGFDFAVRGVSTEKAKVDALVDGHYALAGLPRPALPAPRPARLLPIRSIGHISWVPGVGEQTAVVERSADGKTFSVLRAEYPTGLSGHGSMFADPTARVGESYFYRIQAKNTAGAAAPSNVVGPVRATHRWIVDDLWDKSLVAAASPGAKFTADYDSVPYHNDLAFVSSAGGEQSLDYAVDGAVNQVVVLSNNDTATLRLLASKDGKTFEPVTATRVVYPPLHGEFANHPRVLTTSADLTAAGYRHVRIAFADQDVLSRVEIAYSGAAAPAPAEYLVDDTDAGFRAEGAWNAVRDAKLIPGAINLAHRELAPPADAAAASAATWASPIVAASAGHFEVQVRWPGREVEPTRAAALTYEVVHADGTERVTLNQQVDAGRWRSLGAFRFDGKPGQQVRLVPAAGSPAVADAARWVPAP